MADGVPSAIYCNDLQEDSVPKNILYADDSKTMLQIMNMTFAAEDIKVTGVLSGNEAIEKAKQSPPDIIIADADMPGMNGYELCESVRGEPALSQTPVLILGGTSSPYDEGRGSQVDATAGFEKPFDSQGMIDKVNELLASAPRPSAAPSVPKPAVPQPPATPAAAPAPAAAAAPPPPVPKPIPASPVPEPRPSAQSIEDLEFGMSSDERSATPAPIEIKPADKKSPETFHTETLAEMAQLDKDGRPKASDVTGALPLSSGEITSGLTPEQSEGVMKLTREVIEKVVWEVVPDLAEMIIREKIEALLKK